MPPGTPILKMSKRAEANGTTTRDPGSRDAMIRLEGKRPLRTPGKRKSLEPRIQIARIPWLTSQQSTSRTSTENRARLITVMDLSIRRWTLP